MSDTNNPLIQDLENQIVSLRNQVAILENRTVTTPNNTVDIQVVESIRNTLMQSIGAKLDEQVLRLDQRLDNVLKTDTTQQTDLAAIMEDITTLKNAVIQINEQISKLATKSYVDTYVSRYFDKEVYNVTITQDSSLFGYEPLNVANVLSKVLPVKNTFSAEKWKNILETYDTYCKSVNVNPYIVVAQSIKEIAWGTSWWSQEPRNNPAGIGVTGATSKTQPTNGSWVFNSNTKVWVEGATFPNWNIAIKAHIGHMLAYFLTDDKATALQKEFIYTSPRLKTMTDKGYRGIANKITDLNGKYAFPGEDYGETIINLANVLKQL